MTEHTQPRLPLTSCALRVEARGGLARVVLVQRFANPHDQPLAVTYRLPLPEDAAVSGFRFTLGELVLQGVVQGRAQARETFERAILEGRSGALLEQERGSLFTQELGNVPPRTEIEVEVTLDQPLIWLADAQHEGSWEWRFPLTVAPRYLGAPEPVAANPTVVAHGTTARAALALQIGDAILGHAESPSHALRQQPEPQGATRIDLVEAVPLDRDLVVRWRVASTHFETGIEVQTTRIDGASRSFAQLTIVPPAHSVQPPRVHRDLTLLLDTSGSMQGEPLEQEKRIALALIDALGSDDTLELHEFSSSTRAFRTQPAVATVALKAEAKQWVMALYASGGTEMVSGVRAAMRELRADSQRQIVLITDGLVGFERDIVRAVLRELPTRARLHAVGVGSAVNRSLVAPIARAGRGIEAVVGLGEDAEHVAARVLARSAAPLVVDLRIEGSAVRGMAPQRLTDVFAQSPLRMALELDPAGGELHVRGRTAQGPFESSLQIAPSTTATEHSRLAALYARERVEDCEMQVSSGDDVAAAEAEIEALGLTLQIATRLTSWVAVTDNATVDPRAPHRAVTQPNVLAHGCHAESFGLRAAAPTFAMNMMAPAPAFGEAASFGAAPGGSGGAPPRAAAHRRRSAPAAPAASAPPPPAPSMAPPRPASPSLVQRAKEGAKRLIGRRGPFTTEPPLQARLRSSDGQLVVLELVSPGLQIDYTDCVATVELADGRQLVVELDLEHSSRPGPVEASLILRLALRCTAREVTRVLLELPASRLDGSPTTGPLGIEAHA